MPHDRADVIRSALQNALDAAARPAPGPPEPAPVAAEAVARVRPARSLAKALRGADAAETGAVLRPLTSRHLTSDAARWLGILDGLAAHAGTLPELLAAEPDPLPPGRRRPVARAPLSATDTLALLLEHAEPRHAAAGLTALPDPELGAVLSSGPLPGPGLTDAVVVHGDTRARAALAAHSRQDTRVLKRLAALCDPAVDAAVWRSARATPSLRRAIAARVHETPLDAGLRQEILTDGRDVALRRNRTPLLASGDPELTAAALRFGARAIAQRHALALVADRHGTAAAARAAEEGRAAKGVRAAADLGADALREGGEPYADPARLVALLQRTRGTSTLRDFLHEPYAHDLPLLAAGNRAAPYMPAAARELVRHEDAGDGQRAEFRMTLLNEHWRRDGRIQGLLDAPAARLAAEELTEDEAGPWASAVAGAGLLDAADLVRLGRPAGAAALALAGLDEGAVREALAPLVERYVTGRPEAGAAVLRPAPEFPGTLAELFAEAAESAEPEPEEPGSPDPDPVPEEPAVPEEPCGLDQCAALGAFELLRELYGEGAHPPEDEDVRAFLARTPERGRPGGDLPEWLGGTGPRMVENRPKMVGLARENGPEAVEYLYHHGLLTADELVDAVPVEQVLNVPWDWQRPYSFVPAVRRAFGVRLAAELGADPAAWRRRAAELDAERPSTCWSPPDGPDDALQKLAHGDHTWPWTLGELLCLAPPAIAGRLAASESAVEPGERWRLAAYLMRHQEPTPRAVLDAVLATRDADALRVLAGQARWLDARSVRALVALREPDVHLWLVLGAHNGSAAVTEAITDEVPFADAVLARIGPNDPLPGGNQAWLRCPEPAAVEAVFARSGKQLSFAEQLDGCMALLRSAGPGRLAALAATDRLGRAAAKLAAKALASADPAAVLQARADRAAAPSSPGERPRRAGWNVFSAGEYTRRLDRALGDWELTLDELFGEGAGHSGVQVLAYLEAARRRVDAPAAAAAARAEVARRVRGRVAPTAEAWTGLARSLVLADGAPVDTLLPR